MLAVYAIVNGNEAGWTSAQTLGLLARRRGAARGVPRHRVARRRRRSMPLGLFRLRNVADANIVGVLWAAAMFAWFFLSALYLQLVLGYSPIAGRPRVPAGEPDHGGVLARPLGASSSCASASARRSAVGLVLAAARPAAVRPRAGRRQLRRSTCCPSMILLGLGAGMAFNPVLLAAMSDVEPSEAGLASGVVNTSFMMGGALGLAILASLAAARTDRLRAAGDGAARRAQRRLPRRLPGRRDLRARRRGDRRAAAARARRPRTPMLAERAEEFAGV